MTAYINSFVDIEGDYSKVPGILVNSIKQVPLFSILSANSIEKMFSKGFHKTFYFAKKEIYWDGLLPLWKQIGLINYLGETILNFISISWKNNMKHSEWKKIHSEILFSLLTHRHIEVVSDLQMPDEFYRRFYSFIGLTKEETDIFCSDLENIEYTTNEKQTLLFIQNGSKGILFENNLDTKYSDAEELETVYNQVTTDKTKIIKIVRIFQKENDYRNCKRQVENNVFITANQLANFFDNWCCFQQKDSLAKGMYSQYAKMLRDQCFT